MSTDNKKDGDGQGKKGKKCKCENIASVTSDVFPPRFMSLEENRKHLSCADSTEKRWSVSFCAPSTSN